MPAINGQSAMRAISNVMNSPAKLAVAGGVIGLGVAQIGALTKKGESPMPTVGGAVGNMVNSTIRITIFNAVLGGIMSSGRPGGFAAGAKNGAIMGAILGASMSAGSTVGQGVAATLGY